VRGKLELDPVFRQLLSRVPLLEPVVDLGCGHGQALVLLAQLTPSLEGCGFDWDPGKLAVARHAAEPWPSLRFERADLRELELTEAGTILLFDVLHYLLPLEQDRILRRAAKALRVGGTLLVRELDARQSLRAAVSQALERLGRGLGINHGPTLCFRPAAELVRVLEGEGLSACTEPSWGDLPLANRLIEAKRPGPASRTLALRRGPM
jgi:SAM-dependent methyltransferase